MCASGSWHLGRHQQSTKEASAPWQRLEELGWVQGKNLLIDARWRDGRVERLPALVDEVTARKADVLITSGTLAAIAARNATTKVVKGLRGEEVND